MPSSTDLTTLKAFEELYTTYWKKVYTICQAGTRDSEDAKELTQKIFISVWNNRHKLQLEGPVEHYLFKAARYQVINYYRDQKLKNSHYENFFLEAAEQDNRTENDVLYQQLNSHITRLVSQLPAQCKTVFELRHEEGLSLKEIGDKLNISVKTVQYHLDNAKKYLKKELVEFL